MFMEFYNYCVQTSKWNVNGVIQNSLYQTMIMWKGLPVFFYIKQREGERELDGGETERERVWEAQNCGTMKRSSAIKLTVRK
jgi:hypothetical protein